MSLLLVVTGGCSGREDAARTTLRSFLDARFKEHDLPTAYTYLSSASRRTVSLQEYRAANTRRDLQPVQDALAEKTTYTVDWLGLNGAGASANVTIRRVDVRALVAPLMSDAFGSMIAPGGGDSAQVQQHIIAEVRKALKGSDLPWREESHTYRLVEESGEWRVAVDQVSSPE